jgi:hypothetical protein
MTGLQTNLHTRKRQWLIHTASQLTEVAGIPPQVAVHNIVGRQETTSEGHRWPPGKGELFFDRGGPFVTRRNYAKQIKSVNVAAGPSVLGGSYVQAFIKGAVPTSGLNVSEYLPLSLSTQLTAEGTKALNEMRPTAPVSGLGVTIGELREGVPAIVGRHLLKSLLSDHKRQRSLLKEGSDEYLNWEFGWKPLVADLYDAARAVKRSEKIVAQLYRDSGRDVRRRFGFPVSKETTVEQFGNRYPFLPGHGYLSGAPGTLHVTTENLRTVWVSGMCRYYIPPADDLRGKMLHHTAVANKLLGVRPDPELLWELAPWSWLADWVTDMGSLVGNLTSFAFDGLVWKYAYLMEHQVERKRYSLVGYQTYRGDYPPCWATGIRESKRRVAATPFGFGLSLDSFSLRQWSILAALGISRGDIGRS